MFVLAHLSDPHLSPLPQPRWRELIGKRATGFANWQRKRHRIHRSDMLAHVVAHLKSERPDHIAVTGDLVNISLPGEYAPARAWLESLGGPEAVTLVPGNHDIYVRGVADHLHSHWGDYMRDDRGRDPDSLPRFPFLRRRPPLALIGLSSAVPSLPFAATGRLGQEQVARLSELLERCRDERLFRVVLMHHPPVSSRERYLKRLIDAARFRAAVQQHGAELVIHGHDHVQSLVYLDGPQAPVPAVGVPSASQAPQPGHGCAGYNLYRIDSEAGAWRCEMIAYGLSSDGESMREIARRMLQLH
jgi:3',5'-cyclic AMP phosphodiesterase CpdA